MQDVLLLQQIKITGNGILKSVNFLRVLACTRTPNEVCLFGDRIIGKAEKSQIYSVSEVHTMSLGFLHKGFLMQLFVALTAIFLMQSYNLSGTECQLQFQCDFCLGLSTM